jgi:hypothetical protein
MEKNVRVLNNRGKNICEFFLVTLLLTFSWGSCKINKEKNVMFEVLDDDKTGLHFANKLNPTQEFNMFTYMYFYNGAGIGAGDFNNDGLIDLFLNLQM